MRIRTVKPEFWRSDDIAALPIEDRLLFVGLWSYVDDSGVGVDKIAHICADLFAPDLERNPTEVFGRVTGGLQKLAERGMIIRYEAEGKPFLYVTNWSNHQRIDKPSKQRYPLPDKGEYAKAQQFEEGSGSTPEKVAPGTEEQGNRGTGDNNHCSPAAPTSERESDRFDEFWQAYPRKVGRQKAVAKFKAATRRADQQTIIDGTYRFAQDPNLPEQTFIPHATTWLERNGWEDEPLPARSRTGSEQRLAVGFDLTQRAMARSTESNVFPFKELGR